VNCIKCIKCDTSNALYVLASSDLKNQLS